MFSIAAPFKNQGSDNSNYPVIAFVYDPASPTPTMIAQSWNMPLWLNQTSDDMTFCLGVDLHKYCFPNEKNYLPDNTDCSFVSYGCECFYWGLNNIPEEEVSVIQYDAYGACVTIRIPRQYDEDGNEVDITIPFTLNFAPLFTYPTATLELLHLLDIDAIKAACGTQRQETSLIIPALECSIVWKITAQRQVNN